MIEPNTSYINEIPTWLGSTFIQKTGFEKLAGKQDLVELDYSLQLLGDIRGVSKMIILSNTSWTQTGPNFDCSEQLISNKNQTT